MYHACDLTIFRQITKVFCTEATIFPWHGFYSYPCQKKNANKKSNRKNKQISWHRVINHQPRNLKMAPKSYFRCHSVCKQQQVDAKNNTPNCEIHFPFKSPKLHLKFWKYFRNIPYPKVASDHYKSRVLYLLAKFYLASLPKLRGDEQTF